MMESGLLPAFLGGLLIGVAASLFFWINGRIAGVSGIFGDLLFERRGGHFSWRLAFLGGLLLGYLVIRALWPQFGVINTQIGPIGLLVAGLLVGYGTRLGSGCTSGHGVCGIARLSPRSITATVVFMLTAMITVAILRHSGVAS